MKESLSGKNATYMTQENERVYVESVAKMVNEMLVAIGDPEYAQKIYNIVYDKYNRR